MVDVEGYYLPDDLYYDRKEHIWAKPEGELVRVGLDEFGQKAAGTVAYLKILPVGRRAKKGKAFGSIEAGKYVGPLKAPVGGEIVEVNQNVLDTPKLVNDDPYGEAWFVMIRPSALDDDLADLASGAEEIKTWLEAEIKEYRDKGLLEED